MHAAVFRSVWLSLINYVKKLTTTPQSDTHIREGRCLKVIPGCSYRVNKTTNLITYSWLNIKSLCLPVAQEQKSSMEGII